MTDNEDPTRLIDQKIEQLYEKYAHDPKVKMEYANLLLRKGEMQKSVVLAQELMNKDPMNLRANNLLARIKMKMGQFEEALVLLNKANILSPANPARPTRPIFKPKPRSVPRISASTSINLLTSKRRCVSNRRHSCACCVLTCTALNQPMRINCAMPRASPRSVLTGMAPRAALV